MTAFITFVVINELKLCLNLNIISYLLNKYVLQEKKMLGENLCYALLFMGKLKKEEYDAYKVIAVPNKLLYRISKNKLHRILHINVNR